MPFLTQGNTNWKFLVIIVVLVVIIGGVIVSYSKTQELPQRETVGELRWFSEPNDRLERVDILFELEGTIKEWGGFCDYAFVDKTGSICIKNIIKNIDSYIDKPVIIEGYYYGYSIVADPQEVFEIKKIKTTKRVKPTGWKTYRNEEYGFEIDYPAAWETQEYMFGDEAYGEKARIYRIAFDPEAVWPPDEVAVDAPYGMVEIFFSPHKDFSPDKDELVYIGEGQKIKAFYKEMRCQPSFPNPVYGCEMSLEYLGLHYMIDEEEAFEFYPTIECSFFSYEEQKQYQGTFNQMLSTFRFLE